MRLLSPCRYLGCWNLWPDPFCSVPLDLPRTIAAVLVQLLLSFFPVDRFFEEKAQDMPSSMKPVLKTLRATEIFAEKTKGSWNKFQMSIFFNLTELYVEKQESNNLRVAWVWLVKSNETPQWKNSQIRLSLWDMDQIWTAHNSAKMFVNDCRKYLRDCNCYAWWLAQKSRARFSTNEKQNQNQSHHVRAIFFRALNKRVNMDSLQAALSDNRPFYSCAFNCLAFSSWPCFDRNLPAFFGFMILFSC